MLPNLPLRLNVPDVFVMIIRSDQVFTNRIPSRRGSPVPRVSAIKNFPRPLPFV